MKYYHYEWPGSTLHGRVGRIHVEVYTTRHGNCLEVLLILGTNSAEFILDNTSSFFATVQDVIAD